MGERDSSGLIHRLRRRAARAIWAEHLLAALAPAMAVLLCYLALALFGLGRPALWTGFCGLALLALGYGSWRLRRPEKTAIDHRIEAAARLRHRPVATLEDAPAGGDPFALAVWRAHQERTLQQLSKARRAGALPHLAGRDPYALRILLLLLLLTGVITAGPATLTRLGSAFVLPSWPFAGPSVTAWITPPGYANAPPFTLMPGTPATALTGSRLTVIVNGESQPAIDLAGTALGQTALGTESHRADTPLAQSGRLTVGPWWHRLAAWDLTIIPPGAPKVTLRNLQIVPGGKLTVNWRVDDPYGLSSFSMAFKVPDHPDALPVSYALPPQRGDGSGTINFSDSPYHNLPISFTLTARNLADQTGAYDFNNRLVLPGPNLHDKTAIALDHLRQNLALEPLNRLLIAGELSQLSIAPLSSITPAADVKMAVLAEAMALHQATAQNAVDEMLALIKEIEAGPDFAAAQALSQANQALTAALQQGLAGKPLSAADLQNLLQAMHQALAQHLANLQPPSSQNNQAAGRPFDPSALDQLAQKIAEDEAAGRMQQAAQELRQLQQALSALANARPMTPQQAAQSAAAQQAAQGISQLINAQAGLMDQTQNGNATPGEQKDLKANLSQIQQSLNHAGLPVPGLDEAGQAMGKAADALARTDGGTAQAAQAEAIKNLQKAAAALNKAQQNGISIGQGGGQPFPDLPSTENGPNGGPDENAVPGLDQPAANPAAIIQDRIIKQDANPALPAPTHHYLRRLLDPND